MDRLPAELLCNIATLLDKGDAATLRIVCKAVSQAATSALFSNVKLFPADKSIAKFLNVISTPNLASCVRVVCIETSEQDQYANGGTADLTPLFKAAFRRVFEFPSLSGVTLQFDRNCVGPEEKDKYKWSECHEDLEFRTDVLLMLFDELDNTDPAVENIRTLSIKHLQNVNDERVVSHFDFKSVLRRLRTLRLFISSEDDDAAPENAISLPEPHRFMAELPTIWLAHTTSNLTSLKLYSDSYFGYRPKLDLRNTRFVALKSLAFGNYTFTHNWQLEWILSHSSTLEKLYLDDCPILYHVLVYDDVDSEGYPANPTQSTFTAYNGKNVWSYKARWHQYFERIQSGLPKLREFRIGSGDWNGVEYPEPGDAFRDTETMEVGLYPDRYMAYDEGIGPSQFTDEPSSERGDWKKYHPEAPELGPRPECDEEDESALRSLLKSIGQAVVANEEYGPSLLREGKR